jgi:hypothetical protein
MTNAIESLNIFLRKINGRNVIVLTVDNAKEAVILTPQ